MKEEKFHRHSIRLPGYDYSAAGWYFVTICTQGRECLFGEIDNGKMVLNEFGEIMRGEWLKTSAIRPNVLLDEFVIMPNHLHGIIVIETAAENTMLCRGEALPRPQNEALPRPKNGATHRVAPTLKPNTVGSILGQFKSITTKQINQIRQTPFNPVWQRSFHDHIIRNEKSYWTIKEYIRNNSINWSSDEENPSKLKNNLTL